MYVNPIPYIDAGKVFELRLRFTYDEVIEVEEAKNRTAEFIKNMSVEDLSKYLACMKIEPVFPEKQPDTWSIGEGDDDFDVKCPVCGWNDVFNVCGVEAVKALAEEMHFCQNCGTRMQTK